MTDDKGAGEGPYKIMLNDGRITAVSGPNGCWGRLEGEDLVMVLNDAHAAGRKADAEGRKSMEKELEELLEIAEDLYVGCEHHLARCSFVDWKKARGIE